MPLRRLLALLAFMLTAVATVPAQAQSCIGAVAVCDEAVPGSVALIAQGAPATVLIDADADPAIGHAARNLATDLGRVGGTAAAVVHGPAAVRGPVVLIGELGKSPLLDDLRRRGLIDAADLAGQWEAYRQVVVDNPFPDVPRALVIVGSDRRGAVFGTYDLSERIGVSPWYWFADVPVERRANVFLAPGSRRDQPRVKYRGFFINDEAPAFSEWTRAKFGGANSEAYAHVFELLLRLKGNYLWPAMWAPRAFNDDDPRNMVLADEMGVVMGTSHHEPLTRAQDEWHRNTEQGVTGGAWNYETNAANLRTFWRGGVERMMSKGDGKGYEALLTVGMRGDGDEAMSEGTAIPLLERIVADQRAIIAEVTGKPASATPQVWALYKEVQDYYDAGMQVPDDVTLLFSDDNWGQIRRLPAIGAPPRAGGYGVYYHFDYVGAPRNYKWLDTVQIEKTWQQMDLAWQRGARTIWIVNVGDIKPEEFPLSFFMAQAWNPEAMDLEALGRFPENWARAAFGPAQAARIGAILTRYGQLAARRKPELVDARSFALGDGAGPQLDGGEFGAIVAEWDALERDMRAVAATIPAAHRAAWFELV
ncbi:MAG TPA: glycosyl hydrolase 115 family protein, partial [Croceibacterium sp.]|nr:glycosyl hydrolase 115 family protein [Croceibacterium sp.]